MPQGGYWTQKNDAIFIIVSKSLNSTVISWAWNSEKYVNQSKVSIIYGTADLITIQPRFE